MKEALIGFSLFVLILGCATREQEGSGAAYSGSQTVLGADSQDAGFAREACQTGVAEVQIGKLAARNTNNREVRALARKLADDHARAEKELGRLFLRKSIPPEESLADHLETSLERLAQLKGREFDVAFKEQVIADHERAIALFEKQAEQGTDPELKAFAKKHLPHLRDHLAAAQRLDVNLDYGAPAAEQFPLSNPAARTTTVPR